MKIEDFNPENWEVYFNDLLEKVDDLSDVVREYYVDGFSMSINELIDIRSRLNVNSYFVTEALQPVALCIPSWKIKLIKSKEQIMPEAIKKAGGVTAAKELIEGMEPVASAYKTRSLLENVLSTVKLSLSAAENVSHAIVGKIRGSDIDINEKENEYDNQSTKGFSNW